ncbi:MAG: acyl-CoA dehydrogenase family protein [Candidatus Binatia bacterium]
MDFHYSPQEEVFRQELRAWLAANLPQDYDPDTFAEKDADEGFAIQLAWQKKLYEGKWVGIDWPRAYGGRGATTLEQVIYQEELARVLTIAGGTIDSTQHHRRAGPGVAQRLKQALSM